MLRKVPVYNGICLLITSTRRWVILIDLPSIAGFPPAPGLYTKVFVMLYSVGVIGDHHPVY